MLWHGIENLGTRHLNCGFRLCKTLGYSSDHIFIPMFTKNQSSKSSTVRLGSNLSNESVMLIVPCCTCHPSLAKLNPFLSMPLKNWNNQEIPWGRALFHVFLTVNVTHFPFITERRVETAPLCLFTGKRLCQTWREIWLAKLLCCSLFFIYLFIFRLAILILNCQYSFNFVTCKYRKVLKMKIKTIAKAFPVDQNSWHNVESPLTQLEEN